MEPAQEERAEVDVPETVAGFDEPDVLLGQYVADIHSAVVPLDAAIVTDATDFPVRRILDGRESIGERARGRLIHARRRTLAQGLVRAFVVERLAKAVEGALLRSAIPRGRTLSL